LAIAKPIPRDPPVIKMFLPASVMDSLFYVGQN
jgi:hypothetical protein